MSDRITQPSLLNLLAGGSTPISIKIPIQPRPKPRPRGRIQTTRGGKPFVHIYTPAEYKRWEDSNAKLIRLCWGSRPKFTGAIRVVLDFIWERPKTRPAKIPKDYWETGGRVPRPSAPDGDNVEKAVLDAVNQAKVVWSDDALVVDCRWRKWYAAKDEDRHMVLTVESVW